MSKTFDANMLVELTRPQFNGNHSSLGFAHTNKLAKWNGHFKEVRGVKVASWEIKAELVGLRQRWGRVDIRVG